MARKTVKFKNWEIPTPLIYFAVISVVLSWVPIALVAQHRTLKHSQPPYHAFLDMDVQPKLKAQATSDVFRDGRAMRPRVAGTVARGELMADDHLYRGYAPDKTWTNPATNAAEPAWYNTYPDAVTLDDAFIERGRERYNIFCAPCHGQSGDGNGMVHLRAVEVGASATGWNQPTNLIDIDAASGRSVYGEELYPHGKLFNTITHGARTMSGYASQISAEDRWAIIAYLRALQWSQNARLEDVPVADRATLD